MTEREIVEAILEKTPFAQDRRKPLLIQAREELALLLRKELLPYLSWGTSRETGEDLLHDLYVLIIEDIREYSLNDPDALLPYARGVAKHLRARAIQKQSERMRKVIPISPHLKADSDHERDAIERQEAAQLAGIFQALLHGLDAADETGLDRVLVERFYFRGHEPEAIQHDLHLTPAQFRGRMARLRKKLRTDYQRIQRLSPQGDAA